MPERKGPASGSGALKEGAKVDQHKLSTFTVAPTRKSAFEKAKEQAQLKAEREAAETAAAYEDFVAEYGPAETKNTPDRYGADQNQGSSRDSQLHLRERKRGREASRYGSGEGQVRAAPEHESSDDEETDRRRTKLKASSLFLNQLKEKQNKNREPHQPQDGRASAQHNFDHDRPKNGSNHHSLNAQVSSSQFNQPPEESADEDEESGDDIDFYRSKSTFKSSTKPLSHGNKARLKFLLDTITARRGSVARVTAFAMSHASSVSAISETLCQTGFAPGTDWKIAVARLWCISDILHNSWLPIPNVWKYRTQFESHLRLVMTKLREIGEQIESRIRRENFRRLVTGVLDLWNSWICFGNGVVDGLFDAFEEKKIISEEETSSPRETKKLHAWKTFKSSRAESQCDGSPVDLDGEEINLDGEEIDLDGESANLDEDTGIRSLSKEARELDTSILEPASTTEPLPVHLPLETVSKPKIKMSFSKTKLRAITKPSVKAEGNKSEHCKGLPSANEGTRDRSPASDHSSSGAEEFRSGARPVPGTGMMVGNEHDTATEKKTITFAPIGRRQRRSAADFM